MELSGELTLSLCEGSAYLPCEAGEGDRSP